MDIVKLQDICVAEFGAQPPFFAAAFDQGKYNIDLRREETAEYVGGNSSSIFLSQVLGFLPQILEGTPRHIVLY